MLGLNFTLCRSLQSSEQTQLDQFSGRPVSSKSLLQRSPGTSSSPVLAPVDNAGLVSFDELLHIALCRITNCNLMNTQWLQASLTIRKGGLGVRQVASLVLPAF